VAELIHWNIRGLQANREELSLLISSFNPEVLALQETNLGINHNINYQNYSFYNCPGSETHGICHGGSALIVKNSVPHKSLTIQTNLQATAVRMTTFKTVTICSVYLPPSQRWDIKDLEELYVQLPPPVILMGDFNAHSHTWGCRDTNRQDRHIEDFILQQNLCILNTGMPTYFHPSTGSLSAIDLTLCDPSLFLDQSWSVHDDLCGSDHYPVLIKSTQINQIEALSSWKLNKADWNSF